ncbi:tRNA1(Val) (adenine(37)-N6)-methyltransferase [Peptostreptococcus equinus]|uniref:tRNA1(Val) (Adenine(37)-N6)-methyltransferase n=1 Tax=Peptostreptococcus equinus TaxID=3003601 RepID=A0ABY7JVU1_9FIRM|nr:tRNA1(Val) (adenine(37)-N6)-methyltransferase [Peptostreptococcus sp. CBA3647]WAW15832.1 tRNA1(Val) (adenine(37)-N6)-methyltransferase [Peptostreptococcus sp. CBA3647]
MDKYLKENERIDDLQFNELKIIQNPNGFCFGIDAVLLANFVKVKQKHKMVDLGTGTGIIPILVSGKSRVSEIIGVEIQDEVADMAKRSVELNRLQDRIKIENIDMRQICSIIGKNSYDVVTSNPPYMHSNGMINPNDKKAISRHGIMCDLEDVIKIAADLLKPNGKFFMVNRSQRLVDIIDFGRKYKLEAKVMRFIHSKVGKSPKLVLVEFVKYAKPELKILNPLYVYKEDGTYTEELLSIYANQSVEV